MSMNDLAGITATKTGPLVNGISMAKAHLVMSSRTMMSVPTVRTLFGDKTQISDKIRDFHFSKVCLGVPGNYRIATLADVVDQIQPQPDGTGLVCILAPAFGQLNSESVRALDENLRGLIAGVTMTLQRMPLQERTWDNMTRLMSQNRFLEAKGVAISRQDTHVVEHSSDFNTNGSPDDGIVRVVYAWFTNFIGDEDVLKSAGIDINIFGRIVASSGIVIRDLTDVFAGHQRHEQEVVNIGALRYPDFEHPYFQLYRIRLVAWADSARTLWHQEDKNGISGEYSSMKYGLSAAFEADLTRETRREAAEQANNIFDV